MDRSISIISSSNSSSTQLDVIVQRKDDAMPFYKHTKSAKQTQSILCFLFCTLSLHCSNIGRFFAYILEYEGHLILFLFKIYIIEKTFYRFYSCHIFILLLLLLLLLYLNTSFDCFYVHKMWLLYTKRALNVWEQHSQMYTQKAEKSCTNGSSSFSIYDNALTFNKSQPNGDENYLLQLSYPFRHLSLLWGVKFFFLR